MTSYECFVFVSILRKDWRLDLKATRRELSLLSRSGELYTAGLNSNPSGMINIGTTRIDCINTN